MCERLFAIHLLIFVTYSYNIRTLKSTFGTVMEDINIGHFTAPNTDRNHESTPDNTYRKPNIPILPADYIKAGLDPDIYQRGLSVFRSLL